MTYPAILDRKFNEYKPFVEELAKKVKSTLVNKCEEEGYAFISRVKTIESLAEKIETGRFKKWSDLDDLFACTVIIPTLLHEQKVINYCEDIFKKVRIVKRGQNRKPPDTFRFDSTRLYAKLKNPPDFIYLDNQLSIYDITFEIQIKSAFEHAWSVSTHDLVYKNSNIDWARLRLAAQIKATVEQLDMLILSFEEVSKTIGTNNYPEIQTKQTIEKEINKLFDNNKLSDELAPKDMSRFCDNLYQILKKAGKEDKDIKKIIQEITNTINLTRNNQIPRSISLFQYILALLIEKQIIKPNLEKYNFHITDEFKALYPSIQMNSDYIFSYND
ncbi:MAG: hypothetical protein WBA13_04845 [Microcoleaceae cyanobacterium]